MSELPKLPEVWQQSIGWVPSLEQQTLLQRLYEQVLAGNQQLNLTRITEPQEFWEKHLWDSLVGIRPWLLETAQSLKVIDIGTGGGFPGLPVAIAQPDWSLTLLDSTRKKLVFLDHLIATLGIPNAQTLVDRAEQLKTNPQHREHYDLALIRAVSTTLNCAKYCLPLLKPGGMAVLYRGQWDEREAIALESAAQKLGGCVERVEQVTTPLTGGVRHCVRVRKMI